METIEIQSPKDLSESIGYNKLNVESIETKGYVLIRNFLTPEEIEFIRQDYYEAKDAGNDNYSVSYAGHKVLQLLYDKVIDVSKEVENITSTHVDTDQGLVYFSIKKGINLPWHQDHESYFMNQDHINYLNFYMIIIKEKPEEANLRLIPFDRLRMKSPAYYKKLVGGGATSFTYRNGKTNIFSGQTGSSLGELPYDIDSIAEIPQLNVGDLLLLRGDIIHSTQLANSERVALSFRIASSRTKISLKKMVSGGKFKVVMMMKNRSNFNRILNAFSQLGVTEATNGELRTKINVDASPVPSKLRFLIRIFLLRLRLIFS